MSVRPDGKSDVAPSTRLLLDLVGVPLTLGPGLMAWGSLAAALLLSEEPRARIAWLLVAPLWVPAVFLSCLAALRVVLPRLEAGVHPLVLSRPIVAWYAHLALNRAPDVACLRLPLNAFFLSRHLLWRALGARTAFGVSTSLSCVWTDWPLIEIGPGSLFGGNVTLSCHAVLGDTLVLAPIRIGSGVFVGMNCTLGPGTTLGDRSWVGFGNNMYGDELPAGSRVEAQEWLHGSPARRDRVSGRTGRATG